MLQMLYKTDKMLVVQQPPMCRTMPFTYYVAKTGKDKHNHYLSYPYVQYTLRRLKNSRYAGFSTSKGEHYAFHATVSNKPITSLNDIVYPPPIMHAFDDGAFCLGTHRVDGKDMTDLFKKCINIVWGYRGNYCSMFVGHDQVEKCLGGLNKWEEMSKTNPNAILETKWQYPFKLKDLPCRPCQVTLPPDDYKDCGHYG